MIPANKKLRYSEIRKEMYNIIDAVLEATLKDLIADEIVDRKSYDEIPPRVEYSLTEKGNSVVPILQSICQWSDIFYKEDAENEMTQCQKCDILQSFYKNKISLSICIIYNKDYWWKKENGIPQL